MKKFHFSLERMLHYKQTILDREKDALSALHADRARLEQSIEDCERRMLEIDMDYKAKALTGVNMLETRSVNFQIDNCRSLIAQRERELVALNAQIEEQTQVVLGLTNEIRGLEKLREKQQAEYDYEVRKQEEEAINEIVSSKYAAAQK